jgi:hypothetical protein
VFVHEAMVERAEKHQIRELGRASPRPPADVVRVREGVRSAAREAAATVAVPELSGERGGRLTARASRVDDVLEVVFEHDLDASVAEQALSDGTRDGRASLDLGF